MKLIVLMRRVAQKSNLNRSGHQILFSMSGIFNGEIYHTISVICDTRLQIRIDCDYLLWLSLIEVNNAVVYTRLVKYMEMNDE